MEVKVIPEEIKTYDKLKEALKPSPNQKHKPHLFLGNGFNMALKIDTSYQTIYDRMIRKKVDIKESEIEKLTKNNKDSKADLEEKIGNFTIDKKVKEWLIKNEKVIKSNDYNIELCLHGSSDSIQPKIRQALYQCIFEVSQHVNLITKEREIEEFLKLFNSYYTVNYDPTLYRLLTFYFYKEKNSVQKNSNNDRESKELSNHKKEVHLSLSKNPSADGVNKLSDGFRQHSTGVKWCCTRRANLFYIHGAIYIYEEFEKSGETIIKSEFFKAKRKNWRDKFPLYYDIESETDTPRSICVFFPDKDKKQEIIEGRAYLKKGFDSFKKINDTLVIIGWSCRDNDGHLIQAINGNSNLTTIYISHHTESDKDNIRKAFPEKEVIFFPSHIITGEFTTNAA